MAINMISQMPIYFCIWFIALVEVVNCSWSASTWMHQLKNTFNIFLVLWIQWIHFCKVWILIVSFTTLGLTIILFTCQIYVGIYCVEKLSHKKSMSFEPICFGSSKFNPSFIPKTLKTSKKTQIYGILSYYEWTLYYSMKGLMGVFFTLFP